jgi:hypothetical protein
MIPFHVTAIAFVASNLECIALNGVLSQSSDRAPIFVWHSHMSHSLSMFHFDIRTLNRALKDVQRLPWVFKPNARTMSLESFVEKAYKVGHFERFIFATMHANKTCSSKTRNWMVVFSLHWTEDRRHFALDPEDTGLDAVNGSQGARPGMHYHEMFRGASRYLL